ncbi:amidohydrolase family protein [Desulfovibrio aerotolerans]|uniref:Amidohydrolase family protein n=1 Tax=Solidesulfovibrio aerotolerans TaxID=295255 RepID=A0A7C9ITQ5_9BACT|nr:amidohydrolase family protein [Solidesulfovibrio aerotolerans]MYL82700.1 amidohydrolase family protein [Solidesulfovibrio aerotolerans]
MPNALPRPHRPPASLHPPGDAPRAVIARTALTMVPGAAPLDDAAVILAGRRVLDIGPRRLVLRGFCGPTTDLGAQAVLVPGLLNAHSHLELSHLGAHSPSGAGFCAWVAWLMGQNLHALSPAALNAAVAETAGCGVAAVIDIGSRAGPAVAAALGRAGLQGLVCHEFLGWRSLAATGVPPALDAAVGDGLAATVSGHALYSTSPDNLRQGQALCRARGTPFSLHLAEHPGEVELFASGTGEFAALLRGRLLPKGWRAPGRTPTAEALAQGLLGPDTLAVHAVHLSATDVALLANSGATVCLCPRSNARIGVGVADVAALVAAGVPLALGTDSLASNDDLDLWNEVRALLAVHPGLPGSVVLDALTTTPARLLGRAHDLGRLVPGAVGGVAVIPPDLAEALDLGSPGRG